MVRVTLTFGPHQLGIPQAIVLLDLHDDDGHSTADSDRLELLVAAALLAELFHRGRLRIEGERVSLRAGAPASRLLAPVEQTVGARPTELIELIHQVAARDLRHMVHSDLVGRGALKVERRRKWMVFRETFWPSADPVLEASLIEHLRSVAEQDPETLLPEHSLLALIEAGELMASVFDHPVDLRAHTRLCPFGRALQQIFRPTRPRFEQN